MSNPQEGRRTSARVNAPGLSADAGPKHLTPAIIAGLGTAAAALAGCAAPGAVPAAPAEGAPALPTAGAVDSSPLASPTKAPVIDKPTDAITATVAATQASVEPTPAAVATLAPTAEPTVPAPVATAVPTEAPKATVAPTVAPTEAPTAKPTVAKDRFTNGFIEVAPPAQDLIDKGMKAGTIRQPEDVSQMTFEVRENKNKPGEKIVFARDPKTKEIILATRIDPKTKEMVWNVAGLRDVADAIGLRIGSQIYAQTSELYPSNVEQAMDQKAVQEYNSATIADLMWSQTEKNGVGQFTMNEAEGALAMAQRNDMVAIGTPLVYALNELQYSFMSSFAADLKAQGMNNAQIKEKFKEVIANHINKLVSTADGRVFAWSFINEWRGAWADLPDGYSDVWGKSEATDDEFLLFVAQTANAANPNVLWYANDNHNNDKSDYNYGRTKHIVDLLKSKGLIKGVGMQMHLDGSEAVNKAAIIAAMKSYGLPVLISELDVDMSNVPGTPEQKAAAQAKIYKAVFEAALESGVCQSITMWDIGDGNSWKAGDDPKSTMPTIFDVNMKPKQAYFDIKSTLTAQVDKIK